MAGSPDLSPHERRKVGGAARLRPSNAIGL
jgi:hypothetical protein